jgi:hypothetical protein
MAPCAFGLMHPTLAAEEFGFNNDEINRHFAVGEWDAEKWAGSEFD